MFKPNLVEDSGSLKKSGFEVSLYPWIPLSAEERIPIPADWLVTMVEPTAKLKEMYVEDVINYGDSREQIDQNSLSNEQSDSNQPD